MGRKSRAKKDEIMNPLTMPESQPDEQTGAGDPYSTNSGIVLVLPQSHKLLSSSKKKAKITASIVRRSQRIQDASRNQEIEPVADGIRISDSEKEDELPFHEENGSLGERPDETRSALPDQTPGAADVRYKRMYINSQKKVQELVDENKELNKKLENALGKLKVYEEGNDFYSEIWTVISTMAKTTEKALSLSAEAIRGASSQKAEDGEAVAARGAASNLIQNAAKRRRVADNSSNE